MSLFWITPFAASETVSVASSLTEPVSSVATGSSFAPVTVIINVAVGGNFDSGRVEPSEICIDSSCSNFIDNPDKKRLIIDWIEYEKLY